MGTHLLVPVDGSSESEKAFEFALENHPDAAVTLVHVINPAGLFAYSDDEYFDLEGYQREEERRRESADRLLGELRERAAERGREAETVVRTGGPAREILAVAEERGVDAIVMGSRGRSGVGRILFGSVAETVTRRAAVPVTIVR